MVQQYLNAIWIPDIQTIEYQKMNAIVFFRYWSSIWMVSLLLSPTRFTTIRIQDGGYFGRIWNGQAVQI